MFNLGKNEPYGMIFALNNGKDFIKIRYETNYGMAPVSFNFRFLSLFFLEDPDFDERLEIAIVRKFLTFCL